MKTINKYPLSLKSSQTLKLPKNSEVLSVHVQRDQVYIWVLIDAIFRNEFEDMHFRLVTTGEDGEGTLNKKRFIGTFMLDDGSFVGHLFHA